MKKTLVTCAAVVALFAIAGSAAAITCTVDKRPAATLLVPYFEVSLNADGTVNRTGAASRDTLVTIANASSANMIAHVNVFTKRSALVLDFNIALSGFDVQAFAMSDVLSGKLPNTGRALSSPLADACQRTGAAANSTYLRIGATVANNPPNPATNLDNTRATTLYGTSNVWSQTDPFGKQVLDSLDTTTDEHDCTADIDGVIVGPASGYITIDHANYCNLSNPTDPAYYLDDAIGQENNLWGDVIFVSGGGASTYGGSMVHIEADSSLAGNTTGGPFPIANTATRTFYARYVPVTDVVPSVLNPAITAADQGWGDQREPLGLKYAARWFDSTTIGVTSNFTVWRASSGLLSDLLDFGDCDVVEPNVTLTFYDEDENLTTSGTCPSPCTNPTFNFPWETQHSGIAGFTHPAAAAGWVNMVFFSGGNLDQAYVLYDFVGPAAFLSMQENAAQLDPTNCNPLGTGAAVRVVAPVIPALVGTGK
jgi:hypothetical protein